MPMKPNYGGITRRSVHEGRPATSPHVARDLAARPYERRILPDEHLNADLEQGRFRRIFDEVNGTGDGATTLS